MLTSIVFHLAIAHVSVITRCLCLNEMLRMCYFNATSRYRTSRAKFDTADIDFSLCTHYIYAYGRIDHPPNTISPMDPSRELGDAGAYREFTSRDLGPTRATVRMLSIGGFHSNSSNAFKDLTETLEKLETFSHNAVSFLRQHGFAGLDIDWPYSKTLTMRANLVNLLEILRQEFDKHTFGDKLLLTVKCPGVYSRIGYDVPDISKYADYVILSSDDLPLPDPNKTWFRSALYGSNMSVNSTVRVWLRQGLPVNKAIVGISGVARSQKLTSTGHHTPGSPADGLGPLGTEYGDPKGLAFPEVCHVAPSSHLYFDNASHMHYLVDHNLWIGYENISSIKSKMDWMKSLKIRGVMFAGIDEDDFTGLACRQGHSPLLKFIKEQSVLSTPTRTIISLDSSSDTTNESRLTTSNNTDFIHSGTNTTLSPSHPDTGSDPPSKLVSNHDEDSISKFYLILLFTIIAIVIVFVSCFAVVKIKTIVIYGEELVEE